MNNRRNFYRILRVQPDATHDVIKHSYRSLMQKLRLHPDLGGDDHDASIINQAYATLRNSRMRAAYDIELLSRYSIKILSIGRELNSSVAASSQNETVCHENNQRNYYRILHVQNDAELEVIKACYRTLSNQLKGEAKQLANEAFYIVSDINRRLQYDTLLRLHTHVTSAEKLKSTEMKLISEQETRLDQPYYPIIKHYCKFCKVPYTGEYFMQKERFCSECIYEYWPGNHIQILVRDLSPTGLSFSVSQILDINQVIKIDANHFKAVAQVVYCRSDKSVNNVGVNFLAIEFLRATGNFLSTSA